MLRILFSVLALASLSGGCAGRAAGVGYPQEPSLLAERSLLLLIADRKEFEVFSVQKALAGPVELRRHLAVALGRSGHPDGFSVLKGLLVDDVPAVREEAVFALGLGRFEGAEELLFELAAGGDGSEAQLAVEALARWERPLKTNGPDQARGAEAELIGRLESALREGEEARLDALASGLGADDAGLRAAALRWLSTHPVLAYEALWASYKLAAKDFLPGPRLMAVAALVARGLVEPLERGAVVRSLEELAKERDYLVRRRALEGLARLGRPVPPPGPVETGRGGDVYRDILARLEVRHRVTMRLAGGLVEVELFAQDAPLTVTNFLQLASRGFYDNLPFFRLEPGQWLLTGDPRGDGWGGPGYTLREEISRRKPVRGSLVMLSAQPGGLGPDTAGSQLQILLADQPAWDGQVTVFGRVVKGLEVLERVREGDSVLKCGVL